MKTSLWRAPIENLKGNWTGGGSRWCNHFRPQFAGKPVKKMKQLERHSGGKKKKRGATGRRNRMGDSEAPLLGGDKFQEKKHLACSNSQGAMEKKKKKKTVKGGDRRTIQPEQRIRNCSTDNLKRVEEKKRREHISETDREYRPRPWQPSIILKEREEVEKLAALLFSEYRKRRTKKKKNRNSILPVRQ